MFKQFFEQPALVSDDEFVAIYREVSASDGNYQDLADRVDMGRRAAQERARLLRSVGIDLPRLRQNYGTSTGETVKARYGEDFYKLIGRLGGKVSSGGFASLTIGRDGLTGPERAKLVGAKGGSVSKRMSKRSSVSKRGRQYD